MLLGPFY